MDLTSVKIILEKQKAELIKQIEELSSEDPYKMPGYSDENTQDDDAFEREGHSRVAVLVEETEKKLREVEHALLKVDKGTYGICDGCKKEIDPARLRAMPEVAVCLKCGQKIK